MRRGLGLVVVVAVLAVATPARAGEAALVMVQLYDWGIRAEPAEVAAGPVTFVVRNTAATNLHEMVVLRSDRPPADLPYDHGKARVEERKAGYLGEASDLRPGQTKRLTLHLRPGRYLLICNEAGHVRAGMVQVFMVR